MCIFVGDKCISFTKWGTYRSGGLGYKVALHKFFLETPDRRADFQDKSVPVRAGRWTP